MGDILENGVQGVQQETSYWTTARIDELLRRVDEEGLDYKSVENPFHDNNPELKRANVLWEYTKEEILEMKRCAEDVTYFAKYCKVMTDTGLEYIRLRDYQDSVLREYQGSRFNIFLAPRQVGKCFLPTTEITLKDNKKLPIMDVQKGKNNSFFVKVKKILYKLYYFI
jgi:hypothetical protein